MRLDRIQRLRDCRIFRDFTWPRELEGFSRFNLIYGLNGSGKTTLSELLRGMELGQKLVDGECTLQIDDRAMDISNPTAKTPNIRVFNKETVSDAIFKMPGSARLPPVYVIGEKNVELGKQVEGLKEKLQTARSEAASASAKLGDAEGDLERYCTDFGRDIKNLLIKAGGGPYNNYDKNGFKAKVRALQQMGTHPAALTEAAHKKLMAKRESSPMNPIDALNQDYPSIVELTGAIRKALERSVTSSIIQKLADDPELAKWVATGLELHRKEGAGSSCEFCGQPMPRDRLEHLENHFNDEFKQFQSEIDGLLARVDSMHDDIKALNPPEKAVLYRHLAADYERARNTFTMQRTATLLYLGMLRKAIVDKKAQPFKALDLTVYISPDFASDKNNSTLMALLSLIMTGVVSWGAHTGADAFKKLADIIREHNEYSDNFEDGVQSARQALEQDVVVKAMPDYLKLEETINSRKQEVAERQGRVDALRKEITGLETQMRGHLEPATKLTADLADYLGRKELVFEVHDTGYTISRDGKPAAALSEGERTAIGFLYFLRSLEDTSVDIKNTVIVVDDPASSLDETSIYSAFGYMKQHTENAAQLIVLTHNYRFFSLTRNWFTHEPKRDRRLYMLQSPFAGGLRNSKIAKLDKLLADHESDYHYLFKTMRQDAAIPEDQRELASHYDVPNRVRKLLDGFLAFRRPNQSNLHNKVHSVKDFPVARRTRLLRFAEFHSHTDEIGVTGHDPSILAVAPQVIQDVLDFIKTADEEHYNDMVTITSKEDD